MTKNKKVLTILLSLFIGLSLVLGINIYANGDGKRLALGSELVYYLHVKYDGVDHEGVNSKDEKSIIKVHSDIIEVKDKLPEGLTFKSFEENLSDLNPFFYAVPQTGYATGDCTGVIIDDTKENTFDNGVWNSNNTEYTYHGLHYNKDTNEVTFKAKGISAGCQISIGIKTTVPSNVDDPNTSNVETRRDFYNEASIKEDNVIDKSNALHHYILNDLVDENDPSYIEEEKYNVIYSMKDGCQIFNDVLPSIKSYVENATVGIEADLLDNETHEFLNWESNDVTIIDGKFKMPANVVNIVGNCNEKQIIKYKVEYKIDGDQPEGFVLPYTKEYEEKQEVKIDSLQIGTVLNGYKFLGWENNDVTIIDGKFEMPNKDVVFLGKWELIKYKVEYLYDDYDNLPQEIKSTLPSEELYIPGSEVTLPTINDKDNYIFLGWDKEDFEMPEEDVIVTGYWQKKEGIFTPEIKIEVLNDEPFKLDDEIEYKITIKNDKDFPIYDLIIKELNSNMSFKDVDYEGKDDTNPLLTLLSDSEIKIYEIGANKEFIFTHKYKVTKYDKDEVNNTVRIIDANSNNEYIFDDSIKDSQGKDLVEDSITSLTIVGDYDKVTITYHPNKDEKDLTDEDKVYLYVFENPTEHELLNNMYVAPKTMEFDKWDIGEPNTKITLDKDILAKALWKPLGASMVDVIFHENGHGIAPDAQRIVKGSNATKPDDLEEKDYVFMGWYLENTCENEFDFNNPIDNNLDLYAKWSEDKNNNNIPDNDEIFKVIFKAGEYGNFNDVIYDGLKIGDDIPEAPNALPKNGYLFNKWDKEIDPKVLAEIADDNNEIIYTATWLEDKNNNGINDEDENRYTITYLDGFGNIIKIFDNLLKDIDTPRINNPSKIGYVFDKWNPNILDKVNGDKEYIATWKEDKNNNNIPDENEYRTITYQLGDKPNIFNDKVFKKQLDGNPTPMIEDPKRNNYVFIGWNPSVKGIIDGDQIYIAMWAEDKKEDDIPDIDNIYIVNFDSNGKDIIRNKPLDQEVIHGNKANRPINDPIADKAIFDGYYKDNTCEILFDFDNEIITKNTTIYIKWLEDKNNNGIYDKEELYSITFKPDGGNWNGSIEDRIINYYYGQEIEIAEAPEKEGYIFDYWQGSEYHPGEKYIVTDEHVFVAIWKKINKPIVPNTFADNINNNLIPIFISIISLLIISFFLFSKNKKKVKTIIPLILLILLTSIYPSNIVKAEDPIDQVTSNKFLYETGEVEGFTITKEAHWTGLHEAELNITINSDKVYQPYDEVLLGVDVRSGLYDIEKLFDDTLSPTHEYQIAVKEVLDKLNISDYTGKVFTYNATDSEQVNKNKDNIQNQISLLLKSGANTRPKKTSSSWGMDLFYGIHSALGNKIGWGPRTVKTYKTTSGSICDKDGHILEYNKDEFTFRYGSSCTVQKRNCAGPNDCKNDGPSYEDSNCSPLAGPPNNEVHGDRERPTGQCELLEEVIDPTEVYTKSNKNILVVLFDSGESYISPEDRKSFTYHIPGPAILVQETYPDGTIKFKTTHGPSIEGTYSYETYHIYETQELIKEFFPNATIITLRNNEKDSGRTYGKFFADAIYTSKDTGKASYNELINSGILDGAGVNKMIFGITDNISDYFEAISVKTDYGTVKLSENKDQVIWEHPGNMPTGSSRTIKVKLKLKDTSVDDVIPTNSGVSTSYKLVTQDNKTNGTSDISPTLKTKYSVNYDTNTPEGCVINNWTERKAPFEVVQISNQELSCDGYSFKGYEIASEVEKKLTDNSFVMPVKDVTIRAIWGKPTISKDETKVDFVPLTAVNYINNLYLNNDTSIIDDETLQHNLRYVGSSPNNYVKFNIKENDSYELWRIIGVFETYDGKRVLKIMRNDSLGSFSFDSTYDTNNRCGLNNYGGSFIMEELNSRTTSTGLYPPELNIKGYLSSLVTGSEPWVNGRYEGGQRLRTAYHYRDNNLRQNEQDMIISTRWYTSAPNNKNNQTIYNNINSLSAAELYANERDNGSGKYCKINNYNSACNDGYSPGDTLTWTGKVGLINPSDYKFAQGSDGNWMYVQGRQHTISPFATSNTAYRVICVNSGNFEDRDATYRGDYNSSSYHPVATRPVVFLNEDVRFIGGTGTSSNPYIIGPKD